MRDQSHNHKELLAFELTDGTPVYMETTDTGADAGLHRVGRGVGEPLRADGRFEEAVGRIRPAAQALLDSLREINTPEEIGLEFGLRGCLKTQAMLKVPGRVQIGQDFSGLTGFFTASF